ncbi:uncharacterized protein N7503_000577 [Penicillium pulvis]|uniref:uncharacterized protein n=1 Tax=Penicillium pulvis TaxID=1562058 RepID=UPI002547853D|nr:uncharacterized protein N7503_000577 [Penicillium pulvis]KAJ5813827.1 hypothetical protein N7503_000577 [Penicillium pulvis]
MLASMATTRLKASSSMSQCEITDRQIRTMIKSNDSDWQKYPEIFHTTGNGSKGTLKVQFYPVALATNPDGVRYLSDALLNKVLPPWKAYLTQRRQLNPRHNIWKSGWSDWLIKEKDKLKGLNLSWPSKHASDIIQSMGNPKTPTERLKAPDSTQNDAQKKNANGRGSKRAYPDEDTQHDVPNKRSTRLQERSNGLRSSKTSVESNCSDEEMVFTQSQEPSSSLEPHQRQYMRPTLPPVGNLMNTSDTQEVLPINQIKLQFKESFLKFLKRNRKQADYRDSMANKEDGNNMVFDAWLPELLEEYEELEKLSETDLAVQSVGQKALQQNLSEVHTESMAKIQKFILLKWQHEDFSREMAESEGKMILELSTSLERCRAASERLRSTFITE